jgi:hypothetical protein
MKIVTCQFYTNNIPYREFSKEINENYSKENGYIYYAENNNEKIIDKLEGRSITWYKPHLLQEMMMKYPTCDYILYLDIDAVFINKERKIQEFITNDFSILMSSDHGPSIVNAGVILLKNNKFNYELMSKWWELGEEFPEYKTGLWHDQTCLKFLYERLEDKSIFKIIENNDINSRIYNKDKFIFHAFSYGHLPNRSLDLVYNDIFNKEESGKETLSQISKKFPTDKDFTHNYFDAVYEPHFSKIRENVKKFCEIGVGGFWGEVGWVPGNSLRVWEEYFPNANILGLDLNDYDLVSENRITVDYIDQSKKELVDEYAEKLYDYDIILDDGSHNIHDQQITFASFFKSLKKGGIFVIEDLHSSIEVKIPEKRTVWGWGDPTKITTLEMLESFKQTGKIISDYLSDEEKYYLEDNISSVEIFTNSPTSITSIIIKK